MERWAVSGTVSLDVFFLLSGFIISYNYAEQFATFSRNAYRRFLVNRFARIYPVHFLTMIGGVILVVGAVSTGVELDHPVHHTPLSFVWSVLLLDGIMHVPAYNPPAWSVSRSVGRALRSVQADRPWGRFSHVGRSAAKTASSVWICLPASSFQPGMSRRCAAGMGLGACSVILGFAIGGGGGYAGWAVRGCWPYAP